MSNLRLAAILAGAIGVSGCVGTTGNSIDPPSPQDIASASAQDNPYAGAPVQITSTERTNAYIVDVPVRNASANDSTCQVRTTIGGQSLIYGTALQSQPSPDHERSACCELDRAFEIAIGDQLLTLRTSEPQWCNTGGDGNSSHDVAEEDTPDERDEPDDTQECDSLGCG